MSRADAPRVMGVGARSPLGRKSLEVAMCVRAAKFEPRSTGTSDWNGAAAGACRCRALADDLDPVDRFAALAAPALREAARPLGGRGASREAAVPLFLGLPYAERVDQRPRFAEELASALARALPDVPIDAKRGAIRGDNAAFALALEAGLRALDAGEPAVLVGAVDSYAHADVLRALDEERRLYSMKTDGIIPSEGAAFLLLESARARVLRGPAWAALTRVESAREATVTRDDEPNAAVAMTGLVRRAAEASPIAWLVGDTNGEYHRQSEWSKVTHRLGDELAGARVESLVDEMGDTGAATGALLAAIACRFFRAGCAPAERVLIALHAEGPERAVFALEAA